MGFRANQRQVTVQTTKAKCEQDITTCEETRKSGGAKWDERKRAPAPWTEICAVFTCANRGVVAYLMTTSLNSFEGDSQGLPGFIHPRVLGIPTVSFRKKKRNPKILVCFPPFKEI